MRYHIYYKLFLLLSLQNLIISYIKLPIFTYHSPYPNKTTELAYVKYFSENNIYTYLNIGNPSQKIVAKLNFNDYSFYMYYNKCEIFSYFNINESNSYTITPNGYLLTDVYVYTYLVNDSFFFSENEKNNPYNLTYLFSPMNKDSYEMKLQKLPYTCAQIGLKLSYSELKSYNYNFIIELKKLELIENYTIFIEYNEKNEEEGNIVFGAEAYKYSKKYKYSQLKEIYSVLTHDLYWQIKFDLINFKILDKNQTNYTYYNLSDTEAGLDHNLNVILATYEYYEFIEKSFFKQKIKDNLCKMNRLENNYYNYECSNFEDIKEFPTLYFFHRNLEYTFELNYTDLFTEYEGKYISLIWIDMSYRKYWKLGKPFLKKYFFTFNLEKKIIGFYDPSIKAQENDKSNKLNYVYIPIIIILIIIMGVIGYFLAKAIYKNKINRRKKADELIDEIN